MKIVALFILIGIAIASEDVSEVNQAFLNGYRKFTGDLYTQIGKLKPGSFIASPLSVDVLLALLEYGAVGETSQQLVKGLSLPEDREKVHQAFSSLTPKLNVDDKYTLTSANKIYVKEGYKLLKDFQKIAEEVYRAEIQNIDFLKKQSAANEINKWVEQKTHEKIKNIVKEDDLTEDTFSVLVNALYFHGNWVTKFDTALTKKSDFFLSNNGKSEVDLMEIVDDYKYYENHKLNAKFLELPYNGEDVTMTIVLPNEKNGLSGLEENILEVLETPVHKFERIHVKIPKFKIESEFELKNALENLGIRIAFTDSAQFPKISGDLLKISKVVQKARIEVEEEGTTAAAATAVQVDFVRTALIRPIPKEFIADHPFIFFLKYHSTVLFIGRFTNE